MPLTDEQTAVATATAAAATADEALKTAEAGKDEAVTAAAKEAQATAKTTLEAAEKALADTDPADIKGDINELLTKARKDEKDKMYGKVTKLEEEGKTAAEELKTLKEQNATLIKAAGETESAEDKAAREKAEADNKKGPSGPSKDEIQTMLTEQVDKFEKDVFQPKLDELAKENKALKEENEQSKLDSHRKQLITDNKDSIIEELIKGSTSEELDASLVEAKQAFVKYNIKATEKVKTAADGSDLPPTPDINGRDPSDPNYIKPGMSQAEYAKNRTELLAKAATSVSEKFS